MKAFTSIWLPNSVRYCVIDSSTMADFSFLKNSDSRSISCAKNGRPLVSTFVTIFRYSSRDGLGGLGNSASLSLGLRSVVSMAIYLSR